MANGTARTNGNKRGTVAHLPKTILELVLYPDAAFFARSSLIIFEIIGFSCSFSIARRIESA